MLPIQSIVGIYKSMQRRILILSGHTRIANEAHRKTPVPGHETRKSKANTNPAVHRKNAVFRPSH